MKFMPETLIEDAAAAESWTAADWDVWAKVEQALSGTFGVGTLQRDESGLYAYDSKHSNFESVLIDGSTPKPVLAATQALSRKILQQRSLELGTDSFH